MFSPKRPIEIALDRKKREECINIHGRVRGEVGLHVVEGSACGCGDGCAPFLNPLDDGGCRGELDLSRFDVFEKRAAIPAAGLRTRFVHRAVCTERRARLQEGKPRALSLGCHDLER